jgi:hypothetical protein
MEIRSVGAELKDMAMQGVDREHRHLVRVENHVSP